MSSRHSSPLRRLRKWLPIVILFALAACLLIYAPGLDADLIARRIVYPLVRLLGIMSLSLALSAVVEGMGWSQGVAKVSRPLMKLGHLSQWSAVAFTTAFLSGVAANTLLWNAFQEGKIQKREMYVASLLNLGLPSYTLHLPTTLAITLPLIGQAGVIYVTVTFFAALLRTVIVLTAGSLLLPKPEGTPRPPEETRDEQPRGQKIRKLLRRYLKDRLPRIAMYTVPIYCVVVALGQMNFFEWLQENAASLLSTDLLPVEGISVVVFTIMAEFTAGAAAAGAMLQQGILQIKETVLALLIGNLVATPVRALRHQLPRYLGIFNPSTGTAILLMGQGLRVVSVIAAGITYYLLF